MQELKPPKKSVKLRYNDWEWLVFNKNNRTLAGFMNEIIDYYRRNNRLTRRKKYAKLGIRE
jgi:hypothetical protein